MPSLTLTKSIEDVLLKLPIEERVQGIWPLLNGSKQQSSLMIFQSKLFAA